MFHDQHSACFPNVILNFSCLFPISLLHTQNVTTQFSLTISRTFIVCLFGWYLTCNKHGKNSYHMLQGFLIPQTTNLQYICLILTFTICGLNYYFKFHSLVKTDFPENILSFKLKSSHYVSQAYANKHETL
jgi:hypothetical protein